MKNQLFFFATITLLVIAKKFEARFLLIKLDDTTETKPSLGRSFGRSASDTQYRKMQLEKHNNYRASHKSPPLKLDDRLNKDAEKHARKLAKKGKWLSRSDHAKNIDDGENIGLSCFSKSPPEFDEVTDKWYNEVKDYDYEKCGKRKNAEDGIGHFTQVVWKKTEKLGIGKATGKIDSMKCTWVVGRYSPAGNLVGSFQENVLKP